MSPQVSLPSINELLPEHIMQNYYHDPRSRPGADVHRTISSTGYQSATVDGERVRHANPVGHAAQRDPPYPHDPRSQSGVSYERYDPYSPYPANHYASTAGSISASNENIASSTNVAAQPRVSYTSPGYLGNQTQANPAVVSIQKARPAFRVQIPPSPAGPNITLPGSPPASVRNSHYDPISTTQTYSANPYLSPPLSAASPPSSYRQSRSPIIQGVEEKKHCCPHCNKRFNRPSSLNIHVNTHTGAKPFQCPYPGCQRKFNVNSNMRRHWRNHVSNSRRRDSVARQIETDLPAQVPPTPPLSASAASSPRSHYENSLTSSLASSSTGAHNSRSPSPECSASEGEDGDMEIDSRDSDVTVTQALRTVSTLSIKAETTWDMSASAWNTAASGPRHDRWRQRSRSSPVPRYREVQPESNHPMSATGVSRTRSSSCSVPGCDCQPVISTTLRPAFPSSSIRSSAGQSN